MRSSVGAKPLRRTAVSKQKPTSQRFAFGLAISALLVGSVFSFAQPNAVYAASTPCSITPVLSEANLNTCIAEAPTDGSEFTITLGANFNITAQKSIVTGQNITITSANPASPATLTRDPGFTGRLFVVNATTLNVTTFTVDSVIIDGNNPIAAANNQLIYATSAISALVNLTGDTVLKNNNSTSDGGTVLIDSSACTLNINGDVQIINNTTTGNGTLLVLGSFDMSGGIISGNTAGGSAGGVLVSGGSFGMHYGEISGNTAANNGGGVVVIAGGFFGLNDGEIRGNTATNYGGGIYVTDNSRFAMSYGEISGNTATYGGGASLMTNTTGILTGGEISGNTANIDGGGIYATGAMLTMIKPGGPGGSIAPRDGGWISGNVAVRNGGGIYMSSSTLEMHNGEISGNTATGGSGGGVFTEDYNNLTVGADVIFSSNRASFASPARNPADDAVYAANILGTNWTLPFVQGYNNYDINHDYAPSAPGTGLFGAQISGATISVLSIVVSTVAIIAIFMSRKLLARR